MGHFSLDCCDMKCAPEHTRSGLVHGFLAFFMRTVPSKTFESEKISVFFSLSTYSESEKIGVPVHCRGQRMYHHEGFVLVAALVVPLDWLHGYNLTASGQEMQLSAPCCAMSYCYRKRSYYIGSPYRQLKNCRVA